MNLEMANMKLSDEKVAIEHAQTIIKNLDQVPPSPKQFRLRGSEGLLQ
jgi:hypothetical protein